jgi:signal transduction histidine kinase
MQEATLLRALIEAVPTPLLVVDVEGRISHVNKALENFAGVSRDDVVGGQGLSLASVLAKRFADPDRFLRAAQKGFAEAETPQDDSFELQGGGWVRRWSLPLGNGRYAGRVVILSDVTDVVDDKNRASRLSSELVRAQERERARLASELHDGPVQVLAAALMRVEGLRRGNTTDPSSFDALQHDLREAYSELRSLLFNLRPETLTIQGLAPAVKQLLANFTEQTGIAATFDDGLTMRESGERALVAFRVLQEALTNVRKHSNATSVHVQIAAPDALEAEIRDDGGGFDAELVDANQAFGHIGLLTMHDRIELAGGTFALESAPGAGTSIRFQLPRQDT